MSVRFALDITFSKILLTTFPSKKYHFLFSCHELELMNFPLSLKYGKKIILHVIIIKENRAFNP